MLVPVADGEDDGVPAGVVSVPVDVGVVPADVGAAVLGGVVSVADGVGVASAGSPVRALRSAVAVLVATGSVGCGASSAQVTPGASVNDSAASAANHPTVGDLRPRARRGRTPTPASSSSRQRLITMIHSPQESRPPPVAPDKLGYLRLRSPTSSGVILSSKVDTSPPYG